MKLRIVALGHRMPAWVAAGCDEYVEMPFDLFDFIGKVKQYLPPDK